MLYNIHITKSLYNIDITKSLYNIDITKSLYNIKLASILQHVSVSSKIILNCHKVKPIITDETSDFIQVFVMISGINTSTGT